MSKLIRLSYNVSLLMYHIVCPAKYRRIVIDEKADEVLAQVCREKKGTARELFHYPFFNYH